MSLDDVLKFRLQLNLRVISSPYETFGIAIRSYRQKGLLQPVEKDGAKLILNGKNLIQYLLVKRFLSLGAKLNDLIEVLHTIDDKELRRMILAKKLSLNDLPLPVTELTIKAASPKRAKKNKIPTLYSIEISNGIHLLLNSSRYSVKETQRIGKVVEVALRESGDLCVNELPGSGKKRNKVAKQAPDAEQIIIQNQNNVEM